jgi:hypothetical protein
MITLTKTDIAAIRKADDLIVRIDNNTGKSVGKVQLVKRKGLYNKDPFAQDMYHELTATVGMESLAGDREFTSGNVSAFAMVGIYHDQYTDTSAMLKSLKVGDEVRFTFWPDAHSNGYVAAAGLHADVLYMRVYRKGKSRPVKWEIYSSITPDNSARMVKGVPSSASYHEAADRIRRNAA